MTWDLEQRRPESGMDVYGADEEKIGEVDGVEQDYFLVRKGFFFPQDHYIPMDAIATYDSNRVYLSVTKDQALEQNWTTPPADGHAYDADLAQTDTTASPNAQTTAGVDRTADARYDDDDELNIPVHEEELTATRREVDRGSVRVNKDVIEEEQELDVPVTDEHVHVSRHQVDRDAAPGEAAFEEGTVEVPVRGEEVDVDKRTRVAEEVEVDKTADQHTEHVRDTVRREKVTIDGEEVEVDQDGNPIR